MTAVPTVPQHPTRTTGGTGSSRRAWTVTVPLVAFMMVNFADKSVLGLGADEIRADLHLSATQFGLANSAFFLLFSVAAVVAVRRPGAGHPAPDRRTDPRVSRLPGIFASALRG